MSDRELMITEDWIREVITDEWVEAHMPKYWELRVIFCNSKLPDMLAPVTAAMFVENYDVVDIELYDKYECIGETRDLKTRSQFLAAIAIVDQEEAKIRDGHR
jgi:hypothetical protein